MALPPTMFRRRQFGSTPSDAPTLAARRHWAGLAVSPRENAAEHHEIERKHLDVIEAILTSRWATGEIQQRGSAVGNHRRRDSKPERRESDPMTPPTEHPTSRALLEIVRPAANATIPSTMSRPGSFVTVTKRGVEERAGIACRWCGRLIGRPPPATGRPPAYCRRSCRQRAYEARRRAAELGLGEHDLVVTRAQLDELRDHAFLVRRAVDDARRSMDQVTDVGEARELLAWICEAADALP